MRVECPHAERCTGCPLIGLDYAEQLEKKLATLRSALARFPALARLPVEAMVAADPVSGYRVRAKLVVGAGGAIGLYAAEGHEVLDLPECRVLTPEVAAEVAALRELCRNPPVGAGKLLVPRADGGVLSGVDVREARAGGVRLLVTLIVEGGRAGTDAEAAVAARAIMAREPNVAGVALSVRGSGPRLLGGAPRTVAGASELPDEIDGVAHRATPGAFVQTHRGQAARLHQAIREALGSALGSLAGRLVYDVYGGSGAIGLMLARAGAEVTLVESFAPAARAARDAGLAVIADDAELVRAEGRVDAVVVNPPRRGLGPRARAAVASAKPKAVAYVSCAPDTLARDLDAFLVLGFSPRLLRPFDMIPLSEQVETLALLEPGPRPSPRLLFENGDLIVIDKPPHEPTTPQGEHPFSLLERVRRLPGAERAVPLHRLDLETSGVIVFARDGESAARWQPAFTGEGTQKRYLALVRGVTRAKGAVNRDLLEAGRTRAAHTRYRRVEVAGGHSLVFVEPREGRKHQIRRHMAGLGHPVIGDARHGHGPTNRHFEEKHGLDRQLLHLERLELGQPTGGPPIQVSSPLPGDFIAVLQRLGFQNARAGEIGD